MAKGQPTKAQKARIRRQVASLAKELEKLYELSAPEKEQEPGNKQKLDLEIKTIQDMLGKDAFFNGFPHICNLGK